MSKKLDLTGDRYGRLTVLRETQPNNSRRRWECRCECGIVKEYFQQAILYGDTKSCGCYNLENKSGLHKATYHGMGGHPLYGTWKKMRSRITNPDNDAYDNYGGRGLGMDKLWIERPNEFIEWAENNGWYDGCGLSLDRVDNNRGYFPDNCRFASRTEQNINQRQQKNNTSNYVGVHLNKKSGNWISRITVNKKRISLGSYKDIENAVKARQLGEIKYFGKILHPEKTLLTYEEISNASDDLDSFLENNLNKL